MWRTRSIQVSPLILQCVLGTMSLFSLRPAGCSANIPLFFHLSLWMIGGVPFVVWYSVLSSSAFDPPMCMFFLFQSPTPIQEWPPTPHYVL